MVDRATKQQRMQARSELGNRVVATKRPLPKGPAYLTPHACFSCRKSWKLAEDSRGICPDCGGKLALMGRNFSAPKKIDADQWRKVELLWKAGFRFVGSVKNHDAAPLPDRLQDVIGFIRDNPDHPFRLADPQ